MAKKYDQATLNQLYAAIDNAAANNYEYLYLKMGEEQGPNGNFHCWNGQAHSAGYDDKASLSVKNETGQYKCHTCSIKGNFNTYYKEYIAGSPSDKWDGSYTKFALDILDLKQYIPDDVEDKKLLKQMADMTKAVTAFQKKPEGPKKVEPKKPLQTVPEEENDGYVRQLLNSKKMMNYLYETRRITDEVINKYRIGFDIKKGAITFPVIDGNGSILNLKLYQPWNPAYKWLYHIKGNPLLPGPVNNFTDSKIYIFEGEPDAYCAISHGYNGITCGSASNTGFKKIFGDQFDTIFGNKEIVICTDMDESGRIAADDIAKDLYPVAKQIKIMDLDMSDDNPNGLDPNDTRIEKNKKSGKEKVKRNQTDFTDFFKKNGWDTKASKIFDKLEESMPVYTENPNRRSSELFKVTLMESTNSRYYDRESKKHLELVASVEDMDYSIYKYPVKLCVSCPTMWNIQAKCGICKKCFLMSTEGFGNPETNEMIFNFVRASEDISSVGQWDKVVSEYDLLGTIQVSEEKRYRLKKKIMGIPDRCPDVRLDEIELQSLQHVSLTKDPDEIQETNEEKRRDRSNASDKTVEAYMLGEDLFRDININKSYRLKAVQTRSPVKQSTVLFAYDMIPLEDSFDHFTMNQEMYDMLSIFKPSKENQTIEEHLDDRYRVFGGAAGVNGRDDLFLLNDLAYFSTIEIDHKEVLPSIRRGWVEVLIAGDPRCGKSIVGEFLYNHYKVGEFLGGTNAVKRTGLLGSITSSMGSSKIQWGKFPQNNRSIVVIDEMSWISPTDLNSLTDLRSSGWAEIDMSVRGKVECKVRKIFFSNWRGWKEEDINTSLPGIELLRDLCMHDAVLARFDIATVVKSSDVKKFDSKYSQITTRFTSYQCKNLIYWAYSRKPNQIKYEEGFSNMLNKGQDLLLEKFHPSSQLINQEMRAKLARMSISLATMLFSTPDDDWNSILVKCEHVEYIIKMLGKLYCHPNIAMDEFSEEKREQEKLRDMSFMMNILNYVDIDAVLNFKEGNEKDICCRFADYLLRVTKSELYIVDGNCDRKSVGYKSHEVNDKFIGLLTARNCIVKTRRNKYKKTEVFTNWLLDRKRKGNSAEQSDILEIGKDDRNAQINIDPERLIKISGDVTGRALN